MKGMRNWLGDVWRAAISIVEINKVLGIGSIEMYDVFPSFLIVKPNLKHRIAHKHLIPQKTAARNIGYIYDIPSCSTGITKQNELHVCNFADAHKYSANDGSIHLHVDENFDWTPITASYFDAIHIDCESYEFTEHSILQSLFHINEDGHIYIYNVEPHPTNETWKAVSKLIEIFDSLSFGFDVAYNKGVGRIEITPNLSRKLDDVGNIVFDDFFYNTERYFN